MKLFLFACCNECLIDGRTNQVSLINILEEISAPSFPATHARLNVLVVLERSLSEPSTVTCPLTIKNGSQILLNSHLTFQFQQFLRTRAIADLQGLPILTPGKLEIELNIPTIGNILWQVDVKPAVTVQNPTSASTPTSNVGMMVPPAKKPSGRQKP